MGEVSWWTISVPSMAILVSAVLVLRADRQTDRQRRMIAILTRLPSVWVTRGWTLDVRTVVHNHVGHSIAFLHFCTVTLTFDILSDLVFIGGEISWWTIPLPSLVIILSVVWFYRADKQTNIHSHIDADDRLTHATIGVSNMLIEKLRRLRHV